MSIIRHIGEIVSCSKCGHEKPWTEQHFRQDKRKLTGLSQPCLECEKARKNTPQYKANEKAYDSARKEYHKTFNASPERKAYMKSYNASSKHKDSVNRYNASPKHREDMKRYHASPKGRVQNISATMRYRTRKADKPCQWSAQDWQYALDYFAGCCAVCGRALNGLWFTASQDHWIPLTDPRPDNPGTVPWNIVPLCHGESGCNNEKNDQDPAVWLRRKYDSRKAKQIEKRIAKYFEQAATNAKK